MLSWLRKKTKAIMITVAVLFFVSMFYGLGYRGISEFKGEKSGFIKVNGREVNPRLFTNILQKIRENFPARVKPSEALFIQNLALSQTIDFAVMLDQARKTESVSGSEINGAIDEITKAQKFPSVKELRQAVEKSGITWNDFKALLRDEILVQKAVRKVRDSASVSSSDLREVRARHILIRIKPGKEEEAKKLADKIYEKAKGGADFKKLAAQYSEDPGSKKNGGDLGFFTTGKMVKEFENTAFSLKVSEIGAPVKTDFGYHIIKVEDIRVRKISGASDPEAAIRKEKQESAYNEWFYGLKQKAKVEIMDPALKAMDLRFRGRIGDAVLEYQKAISKNPRNAFYRLFLGLLYEDSNKMELAIAEYKEAIKLDSSNTVLYITLGDAYKKIGNKALAIEQFKQASLIAGDDKKMHEELSRTFKSLGASALVLSELKEVSRLEKKEAFEKSLIEKNKVKTE
ncbi:MAG: PPIC-type PPIASE family protein tetratricopeptide repeat protein [Candidatus Saganbacteria bacterium]|uniref:PPIC-type PPIASE family protein tetratricopeptide repeat protein n=1 Tax=Candidatus Saganbacteria bacterium TaxID=2575572 RepID=A0A833L1B6_UNCSA|nr:MAG: PPIC-type PPIASE family protein tetratricopeptide repeat protein [Candidatus Saganbacteria bacterium]